MQITQANISHLVRHLREQGAVMLLESQMREHPSSTKSYLAGKPSASIKAYGDSIEIMEDGFSRSVKQNPWQALEEFRRRHNDWLFGYFGYDLKNYLEDLSSENGDVMGAPDLFFMKPEMLFEIDQELNVHSIKGGLPGDLNTVENEWFIDLQLSHRISESAYKKLIEQAKRDIYEGDYYEINLSHPLIFHFGGDSWSLYQKMKETGPVPFGGYLHFDGFSICCSSPERFLAKKRNLVWSQPIKGTASRLKEIDSTNAIKALLESEKERSENLMIVDLVRNDLSRIAKKGSVRVRDLFEIQSFETVHQMVSTVECEVEKESNVIELIKACFPMGSMTGAPKIAAMNSIDRLENYKRGIYSGAMGYMNPDNDFDFNVIIRSALLKDQKLVYPTGGAITSDSDPAAEWEETLLKAKAITNIREITEAPE
ncbi:MAG: anthranilate synthase component I family protein [Balneolaceae bacterium]